MQDMEKRFSDSKRLELIYTQLQFIETESSEGFRASVILSILNEKNYFISLSPAFKMFCDYFWQVILVLNVANL